MFNSNDFLLSKFIDSNANDSVNDLNMSDLVSNRSHKEFLRSVSSLEFAVDESINDLFEGIQDDKRMQSIKAILITESTYLKRIRELLKEILFFFDKTYNKIGKRHVMSQIYELLDKFPAINTLHLDFHNQMKEAVKNTKEIGNVIFEFLSQSQLLEVYTGYVAKFADSLEICKFLKEKGYLKKHLELANLEAIITSPIQRFPQLSMAIGDIYKYTPDDHRDRVPLFKSVAISRSITARLDRQRREFEYSNFAEMDLCLQRLKLPFSSKQLLTNNSVFDVRTNFQIPRRISKIPYYLILCDSNVVMLPRDVPLAEMTEKHMFCYSLNEIVCKQKVLSNFRDQANCDLEEARNLYSLVNDSFSNDVTVKEYESLLNDYRILIKVNEDLHYLNFRYRGIDTLKMSKSLIDLEHQLKSKEIELNLQLGSILTLTIRTSQAQEIKKVFLFDSIRQSNEWKMKFNRCKLLMAIDMTICWKFQSSSKKYSKIRAKELPVLFVPFPLKNNGIIEIPQGIVKAQAVAIVVGWKVYRCLWVCLTNGWIVILHFDYKQWMVLESFKMEKAQSVNSICVSSISNIDSPDHPYDSEIWMACGEFIYIYSLLDNQRSIVKKRLDLPSEVKSLCYLDQKMLVALKSKRLFIYSRNRSSFWLQECDVSFIRLLASYTEELTRLFLGHGFIYVLFTSKVIICKSSEKGFSTITVVELNKKITAFFVTADGVWVSLNKHRELQLYDKMMNANFQTISIPFMFSKIHEVGDVTSMYISDKYIWLGTESGLIISIATIDSLYCTDNIIPMYFSTVSSVGPVTQIIPFQNIHGVNVRYITEDLASKKDMFEQRIPLFRRTISNPPLEESFQRLSFSCQNINKLVNGSKDESDCSSNSSLQSAIENLKNTTPTLILAFGNGIARLKDNKDEKDKSLCRETEHDKDPVLFTFLE